MPLSLYKQIYELCNSADNSTFSMLRPSLSLVVGPFIISSNFSVDKNIGGVYYGFACRERPMQTPGKSTNMSMERMYSDYVLSSRSP